MLQIRISVKNQNRMSNSVEPDETAHYEPSHQDLHCLHRHLVWYTGMEWLNINDILCIVVMSDFMEQRRQ